MARMPRVTAKLSTMRKEQEFVMLPRSDGKILIQSDKAIGVFDPITGEGVLNMRGTTSVHLAHAALGAKRYTYPAEFVAACVAALPVAGGETDLGGIIVTHTVQVI